MDSPPASPFYTPAPGLAKKPSRADIREAREAMLRSAMSDSSLTVSTSLTEKKTSTSIRPSVPIGYPTIASPYVCSNPTAGSEPNLPRPASASIAKSASLSRSKASQQDLQTSADALLRASEARSTSTSMPTTALSSREMLANGLHSTSSASLPPRLPPIQSASLSRSKPSHTILQASENMLHSSLAKATPLPSPSSSRSVSAPQPVSHSRSSTTLSRRVQSASLPSHSISRSSQTHLQISADDMLRASLAKDSAPTASTHPYSSLPDSLSLTKKRRSHQSELSQLSTMSPIGSSPPPYSPPSSSWRVSTADQKSWMRNFQRKADCERARTPNRATNGLFKEAVSVDLLFLIDCTGSMREYIATVKEQVVDIVDDAKRAFLNQAHVRVAVVAYRDHSDGPNVEFLDFTPEASIVKQFVGSLKTGWGKDVPEDVLGGIRQAINASWKQKTRCIVHIGDAPPHGRNLHELDDDEDDYLEPGSEPHSLTYEPLIEKLVVLKINYVLLGITHATDLMTLRFSEIYKNAEAQVKLLQSNRFYKRSKGSSTSGSRENVKSSASAALQFEELKLGTSFEALRHLVAISITRSVTRSAGVLSKVLSQKRSETRSTHDVVTKPGRYLTAVQEEDEEGEQSFQVPVEKVKPQWDTPGWLDQKLAVKGLCPDMPRHSTDTLRNMMTQDENIKLGFIQLEIQTRPKPFAQGAMRTASYARTSASTDRFVIKAFKKEGKDLAFIAEEMKGQALCKAFAIEFNALLDPEYSLDFVVTAALEPQSRAGACISIEPFIDGNYVKYNSNGPYVNEDLPDDPCNQAAQAFSHFTFERSWGNFLINDLQGVGNMLTDPAIQTKDPERFKLCDPNLNAEGFKFFFAAHKCNAICRQLQLKSTGLMLIEERLEFREEWPGVRSRMYCSNKLCRRILREDASGNDSARKTSEFPGYYWCISCFPQLKSSMRQRTCAEAYGTRHEFDFSSFFYESQGQAAPLKCPEHVEDDTAGSNIGSVGGGLWARMQATNEKEFVSGR
ncbi:elongation factor-2 kinase EFK-1B isoform [Xylaria cubensis]|nr:elongation factor-2 kinase EFK-1B isoform [Xylaria cubensis]